MVYLTEFVNESKFKEGMHLCFQMMKSNPYFEIMADKNKTSLQTLFLHNLFPKLTSFVSVINEPLMVNSYPDFLDNNDWLLLEFDYYRLKIEEQDGYENELYLGIFQTNFGHSFVTIKQLNDSYVDIEYYHFDKKHVLRKYCSHTVRISVDNSFFYKSGMNHFSSLVEPAWCYSINFKKIEQPYSVVGSSSSRIKILTKVETNGSNNS